MNSMTGYGKAVVVVDNRELMLELKSVNHRFLDISCKMPRMFIAYEDVVRATLSEYFSRGHIDVFVNYSNNGNDGKAVNIDYALADSFVEVSQQLAERYNIKNDFQVNALLRINDVLKVEQVAEDDDILRKMMSEALIEACKQLTIMRQIEGVKLKADILNRLDVITNLLGQIKQYAPQVAEHYREKLTSRITEVLSGIELDQNKLINEVAFFVDKSNVDEEISRLYSHIDATRNIINSDEAVGRKLDFLMQEFNREANTLCSKSNDIGLTNIGLLLKNEIEKVREQVQNAE